MRGLHSGPIRPPAQLPWARTQCLLGAQRPAPALPQQSAPGLLGAQDASRAQRAPWLSKVFADLRKFGGENHSTAAGSTCTRWGSGSDEEEMFSRCISELPGAGRAAPACSQNVPASRSFRSPLPSQVTAPFVLITPKKIERMSLTLQRSKAGLL